MRISPLVMTLLLAILTGALAIAAWTLTAGHFSPPGTPIEMPNNSTALNLTDFKLMERYMPLPPDGWAVNNTTGEIVADGLESFSYAKNDYLATGSNATASVVIYDSGGHDILWNSIFKTGFIYSDDSGYAKVNRYKGMPSWETAKYSEEGNSYALYISLDDRYGIAILLRNASDSSPAMDFADRINIYKIKALKK